MSSRPSEERVSGKRARVRQGLAEPVNMEAVDLSTSGSSKVVETKAVWRGLQRMGGEEVEVGTIQLKSFAKREQRNGAVERKSMFLK